jgi:hypothetical protein
MSQPRPAPLAALRENSEPKTSVPIMAMSGKKGERSRWKAEPKSRREINNVLWHGDFYFPVVSTTRKRALPLSMRSYASVTRSSG